VLKPKRGQQQRQASSPNADDIEKDQGSERGCSGGFLGGSSSSTSLRSRRRQKTSSCLLVSLFDAANARLH